MQEPKKNLDKISDKILNKILNKIIEKPSNSVWSKVVSNIEKLNDPLILSIFKQAKFIKFEQNNIYVDFPSQLTFFTDHLRIHKKFVATPFRRDF